MYDRLFDVLYEECINTTHIVTERASSDVHGTIINKEIPDKYINPELGFFSKNGKQWNSVIVYNGKKYRHRVETLVFNDNNQIFAYIKDDGQIKLPGGSTERGTSKKDQALNEIHEEAKIEVSDLKPTNIKYIKIYTDKPNYNGSYTEVFTAKYVKKYTGKVRKEDEDKEVAKGKFYDIDVLVKNGTSNAINRYAKTMAKKMYSTESYIDQNTMGYKFDCVDVNIDNWKPGKYNILLVTGMSGSGKSTITKTLAENSDNIITISFDHVSSIFKRGKTRLQEKLKENNWNDIGIIKEFFYSNPKYYNSIKTFIDDSHKSSSIAFYTWLKKEAKKSKYKDTLFILEGSQIFMYLTDEIDPNTPIYIMTTPTLQSMLRRLKRDQKDYDSKTTIEYLKFLATNINSSVKIYTADLKNIDNFKQKFV